VGPSASLDAVAKRRIHVHTGNRAPEVRPLERRSSE